jgi:excisionase family DNA binding protein
MSAVADFINLKKRNMESKILHELLEIKQLLALNKKVWTLDDFCVYTGISKQYAYQLTSTGRVKFYRPFGKMIFFDSEEVVEFLKQNPVESSKKLAAKANRYLLNIKQ